MEKKQINRTSQSNNSQLSKEASVKGRKSAGLYVGITMLLIGAAVFFFALLTETPQPVTHLASHTQGVDSQPIPRDPGQTGRYRFFENPEEAHPLPVTLPPSEFINQGIANSYRIAKEIPEVLVQQPCLCGCDNTSDDHRSLLDCFADEHASTCMVCMKEAVYASKMTEEGKSGAWIRDAITRHEFSDVSIGN